MTTAGFTEQTNSHTTLGLSLHQKSSWLCDMSLVGLKKERYCSGFLILNFLVLREMTEIQPFVYWNLKVHLDVFTFQCTHESCFDTGKYEILVI